MLGEEGYTEEQKKYLASLAKLPQDLSEEYSDEGEDEEAFNDKDLRGFRIATREVADEVKVLLKESKQTGTKEPSENLPGELQSIIAECAGLIKYATEGQNALDLDEYASEGLESALTDTEKDIEEIKILLPELKEALRSLSQRPPSASSPRVDAKELGDKLSNLSERFKKLRFEAKNQKEILEKTNKDGLEKQKGLKSALLELNKTHKHSLKPHSQSHGIGIITTAERGENLNQEIDNYQSHIVKGIDQLARRMVEIQYDRFAVFEEEMKQLVPQVKQVSSEDPLFPDLKEKREKCLNEHKKTNKYLDRFEKKIQSDYDHHKLTLDEYIKASEAIFGKGVEIKVGDTDEVISGATLASSLGKQTKGNDGVKDAFKQVVVSKLLVNFETSIDKTEAEEVSSRFSSFCKMVANLPSLSMPNLELSFPEITFKKIELPGMPSLSCPEGWPEPPNIEFPETDDPELEIEESNGDVRLDVIKEVLETIKANKTDKKLVNLFQLLDGAGAVVEGGSAVAKIALASAGTGATAGLGAPVAAAVIIKSSNDLKEAAQKLAKVIGEATEDISERAKILNEALENIGPTKLDDCTKAFKQLHKLSMLQADGQPAESQLHTDILSPSPEAVKLAEGIKDIEKFKTYIATTSVDLANGLDKALKARRNHGSKNGALFARWADLISVLEHQLCQCAAAENVYFEAKDDKKKLKEKLRALKEGWKKVDESLAETERVGALYEKNLDIQISARAVIESATSIQKAAGEISYHLNNARGMANPFQELMKPLSTADFPGLYNSSLATMSANNACKLASAGAKKAVSLIVSNLSEVIL